MLDITTILAESTNTITRYLGGIATITIIYTIIMLRLTYLKYQEAKITNLKIAYLQRKIDDLTKKIEETK